MDEGRAGFSQHDPSLYFMDTDIGDMIRIHRRDNFEKVGCICQGQDE